MNETLQENANNEEHNEEDDDNGEGAIPLFRIDDVSTIDGCSSFSRAISNRITFFLDRRR